MRPKLPAASRPGAVHGHLSTRTLLEYGLGYDVPTDLQDLPAKTLLQNIRLALVSPADAPALAGAYQRNRNYLAPWEPLRLESFFTVEGQRSVIESKLALQHAGSEIPWVLSDGERIIGTITLTGLVRGPFLTANLGYWIDGDYAGRRIGTAAVNAVVELARTCLGLHRIQAATLQCAG